MEFFFNDKKHKNIILKNKCINRRIKNIKICISILIFILLIFVSGCSLKNNSEKEEIARKRVEEIYSIKIPKECSIEFYWEENTGFTPGRRAKYYVFSFEEHPTNFLEYYKFKIGQSQKFEENVNKILSNEISKAKVPNKYQPTFSDVYYYLELDYGTSWMIYQYNESKLNYLIVFISRT